MRCRPRRWAGLAGRAASSAHGKTWLMRCALPPALALRLRGGPARRPLSDPERRQGYDTLMGFHADSVNPFRERAIPLDQVRQHRHGCLAGSTGAAGSIAAEACCATCLLHACPARALQADRPDAHAPDDPRTEAIRAPTQQANGRQPSRVARAQVFVDEFTCIGCKNCTAVCDKTFFMEEDFGKGARAQPGPGHACRQAGGHRHLPGARLEWRPRCCAWHCACSLQPGCGGPQAQAARAVTSPGRWRTGLCSQLHDAAALTAAGAAAGGLHTLGAPASSTARQPGGHAPVRAWSMACLGHLLPCASPQPWVQLPMPVAHAHQQQRLTACGCPRCPRPSWHCWKWPCPRWSACTPGCS